MSKKDELKQQIVTTMFRRPQLTRPEIIAMTTARPASILEAVDDLKAAGMLLEPERSGVKTGRKAPVLELNPEHSWFVGIDFQPGKTTAIACDLRGIIREQLETSNNGRNTLENAKLEIRNTIDRLRIQTGADWKKVRAVGFADPGLVDIPGGVSIKAVNIPVWQNVPTRTWLSHICNLPTVIMPETMVRTCMEYYNAPSPEQSLFLLNTQGGIGGGFIKHGEPFVGDTGRAMEVGHLVIAPHGPMCRCGNRGCLEALAGEDGIKRKINDLQQNGVDTILADQPFSIDYLISCVERDRAARIIASELCEHIAQALCIVVTLLNPGRIVISGSLTGLGELLLDTIRRTLGLNCMLGSIDGLKVDISNLPSTATAHGAALRAREAFWNHAG